MKTPRVGIHGTFFKGFTPFITRFEQILKHNRIDFARVEFDSPDFWEVVKNLELFIFWWRHDNGDHFIAKAILPIIEKELGIVCLPNERTWWSFDDKIKQYFLMRHHNFPFVHSWIFRDKNRAINWFSQAKLPVVFKLSGGAGSENVVLVKTRELGFKLIRRMFGIGIKSSRIPWGSTRWKDLRYARAARHLAATLFRKVTGMPLPALELHKNYVLFQRFLPGNAFDTRVTIIGNRAFAFRRLNRTNDFRSSGSGRIEYDPKEVDLQFVSLAFAISRQMGYQTMAYDFLYEEDGAPAFCEMSYAYVDTALYGCPGYWDDSMVWKEGHFWPQYCMLVDALRLPDLKQPEIR